MYRKFPQLNCPEGVKIVARLRINYGAKQCFSEIARQLGFWKFISATNEIRQHKMKSLLEDVFEAFLGATEMIMDNRKRIGVGYAIVYEILASIFDEMDISLKYKDLYDAKTRLKELIDTFPELGNIVYREEKEDLLTVSSIYLIKNNRQKFLGKGIASLKADAQQKAAKTSLIKLRNEGIKKKTPSIYKKIGNIKENKEESGFYETNSGGIRFAVQTNNYSPGLEQHIECTCKEELKELWSDNINELHQTKKKIKYQYKQYLSTPISYYFKLRKINEIKLCLELNADINISDNLGIFPIDNLFIGKIELEKIKYIIKLVIDSNITNIKIHKSVFDMYYKPYINLDNYFSTIIDKFNIEE